MVNKMDFVIKDNKELQDRLNKIKPYYEYDKKCGGKFMAKKMRYIKEIEKYLYDENATISHSIIYHLVEPIEHEISKNKELQMCYNKYK